MSDYHDIHTLDKVYGALKEAGLTKEQSMDAVSQMQNANILFRERNPGDHHFAWPMEGEHFFTKWEPFSSRKYWRKCVHPQCDEVEYKDAPKG